MQYRKLGQTGLPVSEIGFGAWGIGKAWWGETPDELSIQSLVRAFELGLTFIDTAYAYGNGHSERLIAEAFKTYGQRCAVATKVPLKSGVWPPPAGTKAKKAFPGSWIIQHTEKSLKNLQVDTIDLQQLHVWRDEWTEETEWQEAVARLKKEGKIRFFGVSLIDQAPNTGLKLIRSGRVDSVQVIYNIFDQSPEAELFPLCQEMNVGVVARVPLDEGGLSGKLTPATKFGRDSFQSEYFRGDRLKETCTRVDQLKQLLREGVETIPKLALKFCLSHPAVSTVIPGMRRPPHVEENCSVSDGKRLSEQTRDALQSHAWPRNFYD